MCIEFHSTGNSMWGRKHAPRAWRTAFRKETFNAPLDGCIMRSGLRNHPLETLPLKFTRELPTGARIACSIDGAQLTVLQLLLQELQTPLQVILLPDEQSVDGSSVGREFFRPQLHEHPLPTPVDIHTTTATRSPPPPEWLRATGA
jgi:hypothetical protein